MSNEMNATDSKLEKNIEATLNSLNNIKRAEAPPYFYTRLISRMEKEQSSVISRGLKFLSKPVIGISVLVLFLVLNVVAIKGVMSPSKTQSNSSDAQSFATEYNLNSTSVYAN
ncbi:hypothetical protein KXQ82_07770 [Mucilaginibacter sp. HMF5004]|uniref:hypothetical protein n=1 Tax=Mucilaginibacter rivuli TaxID=2857527 RepID=UPI001C5F917E|nr:hypothetical protein [Mucilaginibacter rivuli]MBW4889608.1 hypothetical protein [Mucilaginibacter rivuli]